MCVSLIIQFVNFNLFIDFPRYFDTRPKFVLLFVIPSTIDSSVLFLFLFRPEKRVDVIHNHVDANVYAHYFSGVYLCTNWG